MGKTATIHEFLDDESSSTVLFRFTADEFVNEAIADLARRLKTIEDITVTPSTVAVGKESSVADVVEAVYDLIASNLSRTHARTSTALTINELLEEMGLDSSDDRWVPRPTVSFPGNRTEDQTIYPDDQVSEELLLEHGFPADRVESLGVSDGASLYSLSAEYVGNNSSKNYPKQVERFERYFEAYRHSIITPDDVDDTACMACGGTEFYTGNGPDGDNLEYNQTFTLYAAASGRSKPLGYRARNTAHKGRCAACLIAGFYYMHMPKIVRSTGTSDNDARLFVPSGTLDELVSIREDLTPITDIDKPVGNWLRRQQTVGQLYTDARGMQLIDLYECVLKTVNNEIEGTGWEKEIRYRPTAFTSYVSEVGRQRTIKSIQSIDPESWVYQAVKPQEFEGADFPEEFWPVDDVLRWFAGLSDRETKSLREHKSALAIGILERDLAQIEQAVFDLAKAVSSTGGDNTPYVPHRGYGHHYFTYIMTNIPSGTDRIDDDHVSSIQTVASSVGETFYTSKDLAVLISFQNANSPEQFLQAFEKAAMQAQKKSLEEYDADEEIASIDFDDREITSWNTVWKEDVETILQLITDETTFEAAKRMFVIHAALGAQYELVPQQSESNDNDTTTADS